MSVTKPIMLDETGLSIVEKLEAISTNLRQPLASQVQMTDTTLGDNVEEAVSALNSSLTNLGTTNLASLGTGVSSGYIRYYICGALIIVHIHVSINKVIGTTLNAQLATGLPLAKYASNFTISNQTSNTIISCLIEDDNLYTWYVGTGNVGDILDGVIAYEKA